MSKTFVNGKLAAAVATLGLMGVAGGALAVDGTGTANATVVEALQIQEDVQLNFGSFLPGAAGGTVVIATDGTRSVTGDVVAVGTAQAAAQFTVSGGAGETFSITLPSAPTPITDGGTGTMDLDTFVSNPSGTGTLTGGTATLDVGATLNVGASQTAGIYQGTYTVTVAYN